MKQAMILGLMICCYSLAAFAQEQPIIEGYVFNAGNGLPLQNVVIVISNPGDPSPSPTSAMGRPTTDSNGFFSIQIAGRSPGDTVLISASCLNFDGTSAYTSGVTRPALLRDPVISRNLYIRFPAKKATPTCRSPRAAIP